MFTTDVGPAETATNVSTPVEDAVTLLLITWLIAGVFIDGYAHVNIIDTETEDFLTPWHAIFYGAFAALTAWTFVVGRRRMSTAPVLDWFPAGYRIAVIGIGIFAVGGIGDAIWHTIFGVEVGIDALLSPTHLILFVGALLLLWTPVRAAAARRDPSPALGVGAAALTTAFLVFFIEYMFTLSETWIVGNDFDPVTSRGWEWVALFMGSVVTQVVVLAGPLVLLARRWRLPFGAATGIWTLAAVLEMSAFNQESSAVVSLLLGGIVFDVAYQSVSRRPLEIAAFVGPAVAFIVYFTIAASERPLGWPPEIWGGAVITAGFTGLGLVALQNSGRHERLSVPT